MTHPMHWRRATIVVFMPFVTGYFMNYLLRTINAVITPSLMSELALNAADVGLLTSMFFASVAAAQWPLGLWLDRYGPRRVQMTLLPIAAVGALLFSMANGLVLLVVGRALIGVGVAAALMAGLKANTLWFPRERLAFVNGWFVAVGALGAVVATVPAEFLVGSMGWRGVFMLLAAAAFASSALIYLIVPDQTPAFTASGSSTFSTLGSIYRDPRFWRLAPLSTCCVGTSWALQGLWGAQWLADVERMPQSIVVRHLLAMATAVCTGALLFGMGADQLRRRGVAPKNVLAAVALVFVTVQVGLIQRWPIPSYLVWSIVAAVGAATVLSFAILNEYFPKEIAGQANGALNLVHLTGAFALQAGIGVIIEQWARHDGHYPLAAYQCALSLSVALQVAALAWYIRPEGSAWRDRWLAEANRFFRSREPGIDGRHAVPSDEVLTAYAKARGWRRIALGSAFLSALLAAVIATKGGGAGAASGTEQLPVASGPFDARAIYVLETFVAGVRSLSIDPVVVRARWRTAYDLTTDKGAQAVDDILQRTRSLASIGTRPIIVEMTSVRHVVSDIFEARWTEHIYERSRLVGSEHFIGRLTMVPKNVRAGESLRNPLGIFVDGFTWSRETESRRQRAP